MNNVIIGNSAGGIAAVEAIRERDKKVKITVISEEAYSNYSRPLISYLLGKKVNLEAMPYREKDFYKDNKIELILSKKAAKLDLKEKKVVLSDKKKIHFDKLLIATGGVPIIPEIEGCNRGGVFTFTKLADTEKIKEYIDANEVKDAVVKTFGTKLPEVTDTKFKKALSDINFPMVSPSPNLFLSPISIALFI